MDAKKSSARYRNFASVVYPESAPADWFDILSDQHVPCFVSPLHDADLNPTGEPKKHHYHVLLLFEGKKSIDQVTAIFGLFSGVGCEVVQSIRGYARYLCHLDNPEKHQYSVDDVRQLCGADYMSVIGLPTDRVKALRDMTHYIRENHIYYFSQLWEYSMDNKPDWFRTLCDSGTLPIKEYIKSKAYEHDRKLGLKEDT